MNSLIVLAFKALGVIFATTFHEFVRAATSTALGDKKPKNEGRLTINPVKHFEPIGFILCFLTGFGWGKPVETNAMFYKNRKNDTLITAIAPIISNFVAGIVFLTLIKFSAKGSVVEVLLYYMAFHSIALAVYNIVPVSPMDGVKVLSVLMPANSYFKYIQYEKIIQMGFLFMLFLGYTNIIFSPIISLIMALFS